MRSMQHLVRHQNDILKHRNILRMNISLQSLVTKSIEEVDKYLEREELVTKEYVEWIKDTTNENVLNIYKKIYRL